ncbi:MAG TPA: hypothetical protein VLA12_12660, partial [Planctomycetaceae bacterium]|nr:hypothetical protein [Planctomycetaceae bacterium]
IHTSSKKSRNELNHFRMKNCNRFDFSDSTTEPDFIERKTPPLTKRKRAELLNWKRSSQRDINATT